MFNNGINFPCNVYVTDHARGAGGNRIHCQRGRENSRL